MHHFKGLGDPAPPPGRFFRRSEHCSFIIGNYLYIDGGYVTLLELDAFPDASTVAASNTISIPLDSKWSNFTVQPKKVLSSVYKWTTLSSCWVDESNKLAYRLGGQGLDQRSKSLPWTMTDEFWQFQADGVGGGTWFPLKGIKNRALRPYTAFSGSTGYRIGGFAASNFSLHSQMFEYDFASRIWNQGPPVPPTRPNMQGLALGRALYVPSYGRQGVIVLLGGLEASFSYSSPSNVHFGHLTNITIFDIASRKWHWQMTTGQQPLFRSGIQNFCAVGKDSPNGNFDIFVFGGRPLSLSKVLSPNIYILSIPSFRWMTVSQQQVTPRMFLTCESANNRQMIVIGGTDVDTLWAASKDSLHQGIGVFDLTELRWLPYYDPKIGPYKSNEMISEWYAKHNHDSVNWSSEAISEMFKTTNSRTHHRNPFNISLYLSKNSSTSTNTLGLIIGPIIGGSLFLISLGLGYWYYKRRHWLKNLAIIDQWLKPELEGNSQQILHEDVPQLPHVELQGFNWVVNVLGEQTFCQIAELDEGIAELEAEPFNGSDMSRTLNELGEKSSTRRAQEIG